MGKFIDWMQTKENFDNPYDHAYSSRDIKSLGHGKAHPSLVTRMGGSHFPSEGDEFIFVEPDGSTQKATVTHSSGVGGLGKYGELRLRTDDGQIMSMDFGKEYKLGHISLVGQTGSKKTFRVQFS
jgi:hypothetical protein